SRVTRARTSRILPYTTLFRSTSIDDLKAYFRSHLLNLTSPYLNHEFVKADFDFYSSYLGGVEKMRPRWRRVLAVTDGALGEALRSEEHTSELQSREHLVWRLL